MNKTCPKCGCRNVLPPEPENPTPCENCGVRVFPELDPVKRLDYENLWEY